MTRIPSREARSLWALLGLAFGTYALSRRYYTTASFEYPLYFTIVTCLLTSAVLRAYAKWTTAHRRRQSLAVLDSLPQRMKRAEAPAGHKRRRSSTSIVAVTIDIAQRLNSSFLFLLVSISIRSILFWNALHLPACAKGGIQAFLPFFVLIADKLVVFPRIGLPNSKADLHSSRQSLPTLLSLFYAVITIAWALATMNVLEVFHTPTGAICPIGWRPEPYTPVFQIIMCGLDAAILVYVARLRNHETHEDCDVFMFLAVLLAAVAACVSIISALPVLFESSVLWKLQLDLLSTRDLLVDSSLACLTILCALSLLSVLHPTTVALVATSASLYGFLIPNLEVGLWRPTSPAGGSWISYIGPALLGFLLLLSKKPKNSPDAYTTSALHRWLLVTYVAIFVCSAYFSLHERRTYRESLSGVVSQLVSAADARAEQWESQAAESKSLRAAVIEYERRYSMPPPPNFDKWYDFAINRSSAIIDDFAQVQDDLLPFWGVKPSLIRDRTDHLLSEFSLQMGGLRIRNGAVEKSPHVPGTHLWMMENIERMIQPFAQWLPDMVLAINLSDECRVAVPWEQMIKTKATAVKARQQIQNGLRSGGQSLVAWPRTTMWPKEFARPSTGPSVHSKYFTNNIRRQLYYQYIAPTCPPDSKARNSRWWDMSTACADCAAKHSRLTMDGSVITDNSLAHDLCHQPDMAYLDGFVRAPTMVGTRELFPVFSQGRVGGFSDILFPSPWNYGDKTSYEEEADMDWAKKKESLFWRGSSSDGYAWDNTWTGFGRARLVHEGYQQAKAAPRFQDRMNLPTVNVSFTGDMSKCHEADCAAELEIFSEWSTAAAPGERKEALPPQTPFSEHWRHRHLIDMDGAGFSGRFLPFLQSRSLVYRAALFRTWFDERVRPWHHYVPVDMRLGKGFWSLLEYMSGGRLGTQAGGDAAQQIAQNGQDWANKALRHDDMEIYMFRLLLEWGRVVDDERQHLGFSLT